jgi:DNA-binding transcriptional MocR family regulator
MDAHDGDGSALEDRLRRLERRDGQSLTAQLVELFAAAIASGELGPGEKLPPTRALAALAGVNQLTASRCYRRLQAMGAVVSEVGRGTFVRTGVAAGHSAAGPGDTSWQSYVLAPERVHDSDRIIGEMARHVEDPDVIPLSAGYPTPDLLPVDALLDATVSAVARRGPAAFQYFPIEGVGELRRELAELGRRRGLDDDPDAIVVTTGARQALTLAARATLRPGDKVACESPSFMGMIEALRTVGAEVFPVPIDGRGLDIDALESLLRRHEIRLLAIQPRLHNPTGADLAPERRRRLVELAHRHGFFILEDAVYADLRFEGPDQGPLRALAPAHVIYVDSMSKTLGPGLRAGWVAASGPVLDRIIVEKRRDDIHSATLTQLATAGFLAAGAYPAQLAQARELYRERRDVMLAALDHELGDRAEFGRPRGGGHVWVTVRRPVDEAQLYREALAAGVTFVPGSAMLIERPRATQFRLSFGLADPEQIREGVRRLARALRSLALRAPQRRSLPIA